MKSEFTPAYDDPLVGPFWRAAREGQLCMSWCEPCDRAVWYPREACPDCGGALYWKPLSGKARLISWSVVRKAINPLLAPVYMPALVEPEEAPGVRLVTQLVQCDPDALQCDMVLKVVFDQLQPYAGEPYRAPLFTPV